MIRTLILSSIAIATVAHDAAAEPPALRWMVGDWTCFGTYETTPVTVAHTVTASFHVAPSAGGAWVTGSYAEFQSSNGALLALEDSFSIDPFVPGAGLRTFIDSQSGQFRGGFAIIGAAFEFVGDYLFAHQAFPYSETLTRAENDTVFTTEARVSVGGPPVVFHRQRCVRTH